MAIGNLPYTTTYRENRYYRVKEVKHMEWYTGNIEEETLNNTFFRKVLFTGPHSQLVVMNLAPGEEIGEEVHGDVDQFFRFEDGVGLVIINGESINVEDGDAVIVPAGSKHNIVNTSQTENLKLYTIYSPPNHPEGSIHKTKVEADLAEEHH
jgi:mannose-6-phosphate isomerase-like protein (cupin superfamily)